MASDWTISLVDTIRVKGKPPNWMPSAKELLRLGVPLKVARRWARERRDITANLKRRVRENTN